MDTTVKYAIELINKWGAPLRSFEKSINNLGHKKVIDPFRDMPRSIAQLRANIERYKKASDETMRSDHVRKYKRLIEETARKIKNLEASTLSCGQKTEGFLNKLGISNRLLGFGSAIIAVRKGIRYLNESIMTSAQVEKYSVTLKTMLGSQGAARDRMREYFDIAKRTPFELSQVVEAGNQLQAIGRYSRENLVALGDLAAASGKPIEQVMNAYAKLATGQKGEGVNMFRDLLISTDDWAKATGKGKRANGELIASTEEMIAALPKIMQTKGFYGMMEQQARTTEGKISNLKDSMFQLKVAVGDRMKPSFDSFIRGATNTVDVLTRMIQIPTSQKIAKEKAELNSLVGIITNANTSQEERSRLLKQIQQQYPEFLKNIDLETVKNEELKQMLAGVNQEYDRKIKLAAMQDKVTEEERKLQELEEKKYRALLYRQAQAEVITQEEFFSTKYGIEDERQYSEKGTSGLDFYQNLERAYAGMESRLLKNPKDKEASEFVERYNELLAYKSIADDQGYKANLANMDKINAEIDKQKRILDIYNKNVTESQRTDIWEKAQKIDVNDKSVYDLYFGKEELKKEFADLKKKTKETLTETDWGRLLDFVEGRAKYTKTTPGGLPDNIEDYQKNIVSGGSNIKNYNITIEKLVETIEVHPKEMNDAVPEFTEVVKRELLVAVNDINRE